jgi:hypothetical protein
MMVLFLTKFNLERDREQGTGNRRQKAKVIFFPELLTPELLNS